MREITGVTSLIKIEMETYTLRFIVKKAHYMIFFILIHLCSFQLALCNARKQNRHRDELENYIMSALKALDNTVKIAQFLHVVDYGIKKWLNNCIQTLHY